MGTLTLPLSGLVYADAQIFIYSVEKHPRYAPLLLPLWQAVQAGSISVVTSGLSLMETLVSPLKTGNTALASLYEEVFRKNGIRLLPITQPVLREAARLRAATPSLRTPDAIHAATGLLNDCSMFLSNDSDFRDMPGLFATILDDVFRS